MISAAVIARLPRLPVTASERSAWRRLLTRLQRRRVPVRARPVVRTRPTVTFVNLPTGDAWIDVLAKCLEAIQEKPQGHPRTCRTPLDHLRL